MTEIAYQLYCSRNFPPLEETCEMLGKAGYKFVEGYGALFEDPNAVKAALDSAGLHMKSSHIGLDMIENDVDGVLKLAEMMGIEKVFCPFLQDVDRPTDDDGWRALGVRLAKAGKPIVDAGLAFGWHNHAFEFEATDSGAIPIDLMAEGGIDLELDLGWVARAGLNPVDWINKYGSRIAAVHVKDIAPDGDALDEDGWADVGHGVLDWPAILGALDAVGVDYFVVEHDNPNDHVRFAQRSLSSLNTLKGKG